MNSVSLDLLETFVAIARAGNLTRAAEAKHVTVSALSHRMRQLEERLDVRLLVREPRGVTLTGAGQRLFGAVGGSFETLNRALRGFCSSDATFTLSTVPLLTNGWLMSRLPDFLARYPQITMNLQSEVALVDFEREPVDAALRLGGGGWPHVHSEFLFSEWVRPVASPELIRKLGGVKLSSLSRAPLLGDPDDLWKLWFTRYGGEPPRRFVAGFNDSVSVIHAAAQGVGVALGRETLAQPLVESGRLVALTRRRMDAGFAYYLVFPSRSRDHRGFVAFRDWLYRQLAVEPPSLPLD